MQSVLGTSATGWRRRRRAAAGLATLLLAALAGCGGGGGEEGTEADAIRAKLLAAAERLADAPSLDASVSIEASEEDSTETTSACFGLAVVRGEKSTADDQVVLRTYDGECGAGEPSAEVIVIGRDVWASQLGDQWTQGRVDPALVDELTDEEDEYDELLAAAEDIRPGEEPRSYEFTAPASSFSQTEDIGDVDVDFVLTLDEREVLRGLVATIEAEGARAVVEQSYEIGRVKPVRPPPAGDVVGPVRRIDSEAELESLLEPTFDEGFE